MSSPLEKSAVMNQRYENLGEDPWGNRERKLYQKIFKKAAQLAYQHLTIENKVINLYDIGAGGGNVIDVWAENLPDGKVLRISGCDISEAAIRYLEARYENGKFNLIDLEDYKYNETNQDYTDSIGVADIVSIVDVMYYFDAKRSYHDTLDEIWKSIKPGAIVVVADNLVRSFRRDYLTKKEDAELLESYTDYTEKICEETSDSGKKWNRYLKVRIMRKKG